MAIRLAVDSPSLGRRSMATVLVLALVSAGPVIEAPPTRVGQIIIQRNDRADHSLILRRLPLFPGEVISYPLIRLAERWQDRTALFEGTPTVKAQPNPLHPGSEYRIVVVSV